MNSELDKLLKLDIAALNRIYRLINEVRADEIHAAKGVKVAHTRIRVKLAEVASLCKVARKYILLKMKNKEGKVEKYGVDENGDESEKRAVAETKPKVCPQCGSTLEEHGEVVLCPKCGSDPFEAK